MFYVLSKALNTLAEPLAWVAILAIAAAILSHRTRLAVALGAASVILGVAFASPGFVKIFQRWLESSARSTFRAGERYDAAIVLDSDGPRLRQGAELVRLGRARHLLVICTPLMPAEMGALQEHLAASGVPADRVTVAATSRNTHEDALTASRIVSAHGWRSVLLVTSAAHVQRALGCFQRAGLRPDVLPVDFRGNRLSGYFPSQAALQAGRDIIHEAVGRLVYRAVGYAR